MFWKCLNGEILTEGKNLFLQALSSKENSEENEFEDTVRTGLADEEKQRIEDQQLKQKAIAEKDLVGHRFWWNRRNLAKKRVGLCC